MPQQQQRPRGPFNVLHSAAEDGSLEGTVALLSVGWAKRINQGVDRGNEAGWTPLMFAAFKGHARVSKMLLDEGASVSIAADDGLTPLLLAAQCGHLEVTEMMIGAGAHPDEAISDGYTSLHFSSGKGYWQVVAALIEAGANVNSRGPAGVTPLYAAAWEGRVAAVTVLLRAEADPLLTRVGPSGRLFTPLDAAAHNGHADVVRELVRRVGMGGLGGANAGERAFRLSGQHCHLNVMAVLTSVGIVDTGSALCGAAGFGNEASVKFLLKQEQKGKQGKSRRRAHADAQDNVGRTPLLLSIAGCRSSSPRIVRLLINAGADTASAVLLTNSTKLVIRNLTPLATTEFYLHERKVEGKDATKEQMHQLQAIRRLLLGVEAVHADSWVWPNRALEVILATKLMAKANMSSNTETPLAVMLPTLRLTATRRGALLAALFRHSSKDDQDG